jgi:hypothetical protein
MSFVMVSQWNTLRIATDKVCKEGSKYCPVHKTYVHDTKECKVLLAQVKKILALYESKTSFHNNKCQKTDYNKYKSEHVWLMANAFKATNCKEKKNIFSDKKRIANENYVFDNDIFDAFNITMMMSATNMRQTRIPMKKKSAVVY